VYGKASFNFSKIENTQNAEYYVNMVEKNFDNPSKIMNYINQKNRSIEKHTLLFNHPDFLKA
jgi:GH35 family endo-1,4-beta-xylanase